MWAKPNQLTTAGIARPLRVAYLIDTDDCPDQLLDRIFAEAYGRWGGRRTLIIPAKPDGIDERYTEWLRSQDFWGGVRAVRHENHAACVPLFDGMHSVQYRYKISFSELRARETAEFRDTHAYVPHAIPWHMREAPPPAGLREGNWMVDLAIDRLDDHCRFANARYTWVLPRRLRLEKAFKVECQDERPQGYGERVSRASRQGYLALPKSHEHRSLTITIPNDIEAFRGLCIDTEWSPFERGKDSPRGRRRYAYAEPSDKGRYLLAVLEHFETLPDAFDVLMNGYWRDVLISLGAVPVEKNTGLRGELISTLRKRLGRPKGDLTFSSETELDRLARESIRFGQMAGKSDRFVDYGTLHERWKALLDADLEAATHLSEADKAHYSNRNYLDRSIQNLCQPKSSSRVVNGNADAASIETGQRWMTCAAH
jgi:hypothetical protein